MCGFSGFVGTSLNSCDLLRKMGDTLMHRGPDDFGSWHDEPSKIGLSHRRLSIIDLSPSGHQPMKSFSGRYIIAYNGEIYNHLDIRKEITDLDNKVQWRGHSDTEILLAGIDVWGLEKTLKKSFGMFAIALWDRQERSLYLACDRMGEKPLYYGWQSGVFLFGSELKALKVHPAFEGVIDRDALTLLLRYSCIPAPYSIYKGIKKLQPGRFLKLSVGVDKIAKGVFPEEKPFWSLEDVIRDGVENPFIGSDLDAVETLHHLLRDSVQQQMVADVPLGAFLSGGVDSSVIAALMQEKNPGKVKTFSIGFNEVGYNEAVHAKSVAGHLGTEHTELYVTPEQAMDVIPRLPTLYDEPFSDSSQIPTFLVSEMAQQYVKVSLSGDAGDELFGGYNRHIKTDLLWDKIQLVPRWVRRSISKGILSTPPAYWNKFGHAVTLISGNSVRWQNLERNINKLASVLKVDNNNSLYSHFVSNWKEPESIVINGVERENLVTHPPLKLDSIVEQMMALDSLTYLPDDILVKVDRAAMGVSLETRIPFLDHKIIEFAWKLPLSMKIRHGKGKWILRQVLNKYVPSNLIERPKMGFGVPIDSWLRGSLREWAENLLDESRMRQEGFLNPGPIRKKWSEHLSGKSNWQNHIWDVLMFQAWLAEEG
jgi:asparagine synthase (glutamine-hydrolysing)